ncbi:efflux transporter outer membrane subunit [Flaviaesturariibacter amylovorans]|uniref:Efflux transporter outer membrane subunit n=1 Tax=Flaviaesturariibacter amylovorans TaxID=1084520 RepID=A0ABP8HKU1_9BACT
MKQIRYIALLPLLTLLLSACSTAKEYAQPELKLPARFAATPVGDTSSIADLEWAQFFTDPQLRELINKGIAGNYDLQLAANRVAIAQQASQQARYLFYPDINLGVTAQYNRPANNSLSGVSTKAFLGARHIENYQTLLSASWEPDIWGKLKAQRGAALTGYLQSYEAKKAVQTALVAGIAQGYYHLQMLDEQLAIARRNLALSDSFVTTTQLLKEAGMSHALAVQQAEAQRQGIRILLPQLEAEIARQEHALQLLLGGLPGPIARGRAVDAPALPAQWSTGLPAAVVSRRPDVRANELALMIANARVGIAKADMYPALNITAGAGLEAFQASNWWNLPGSLFGMAAGSVLQPVFRKKALRTRYAVAQLERDGAVVRFRQSVLGAVTEVSDALAGLQKLREEEEAARAQVAALRDGITSARLLFRSDLATYLEVLNAQANALQAELGLAALQRRKRAAQIELYRALGGGWK